MTVVTKTRCMYVSLIKGISVYTLETELTEQWF